jgi:drug/metabolite transporter (DMT)-like permease
MLVLATAYWGVSFPVIKSVTSLNLSYFPWAGTAFVTAMASAPRFVVAVLLLIAFTGRARWVPNAGELRQGLWVGAFAAAGTLLQTDGMQFTSASTSAFLTQLSAILVPALMALRYRRNPGALAWSCCGLVLVGVAILGHFDWRALSLGRGECETLLCAVFFTGQIIWIGKGEFVGNRPGPVTFVMFAVQAVALSAFAVVTAPSMRSLTTPWASPVWLSLTLVLAVVCTIGAFSLMTRWQPSITATEAGLIYCAEPVFTSLFALFLPALLSSVATIHYPNEHATLSLLLGGGLVTVANVVVQVKGKHTS